MKIIVSNIDWDCNDDSYTRNCPNNLPSQVIIDDPVLMAHLSKDICGDADNLAEYLTDKYGYCVRGFTAELEGMAIS